MRYLHTMIRVSDLDATKDFFATVLGLRETHRIVNEKGRFTLVYLAAPEDMDHAKNHQAPEIELTWNWDPESYTGGRNFGHIAFEVNDIYAVCQKARDAGVIVNRPPRDGHMAFLRTPDSISIELLQKGEPLAPAEPWASMANTGSW